MENTNNIYNFDDIKKKFVNILKLREDVSNKIDIITNKIDMLKKIYKDMMKENNSKSSTIEYQHSIFGIDGFLFQNKLIDMEYKFIISLYKTIDNRLFYDYTKLYSMLQQYVNNNLSNNSIKILDNDFPQYKQLETTKQYDISHTIQMQSIIINTITDIFSYLKNREKELESYKKQYSNGLKIDTLINTQNYHNIIIKTNLEMFLQYLNTFNEHHSNYLNELLDRITYIIENVNKNIKITNNSDKN